jgi:site-specific DNA-methyltransferase (cytosine-N4-specific)
LRDYGTEGQIGLEDSPDAYIARLREVFAEVHRVLADGGTFWLNIGDSYYSGRGNPGPNAVDPKNAARRGWIRPVDRCGQDWGTPKSLLMIPERMVLTLQDDGWLLRNKGVWHKPNSMPESVGDRLAGKWEPFYLLTKNRTYWFDLDAIREPHSATSVARTRRNRFAADHSQDGIGSPNTIDPKRACHEAGANPGDVWHIGTQSYSEAHFAVFPLEFPLRCIKAGCKPDGVVLDPFSGSGTTGEACRRLGRRYIGIDLNPAYHDLAVKRYAQGTLESDMFGGAA